MEGQAASCDEAAQLPQVVPALRQDLATLWAELREERRLRLLLEERLRSVLPAVDDADRASVETSVSGEGTTAASEANPAALASPATSSSSSRIVPATQQQQHQQQQQRLVAASPRQPTPARVVSSSSLVRPRESVDQQEPQQQQDRWESVEKRLASLEENVWALTRQQGQALPAASGLLSNLLGRVEDKSKAKRRAPRGGEVDSDDESGSSSSPFLGLSPQELAEVQERTANRSVHAIVKDGNLLHLRVKLADNAGLVNLKDEEGQTPLHVACIEHPANMDIVRFLLANNADANAVDFNGWTPLHAACKSAQGNGDLVRLLLNNGAEATLANADETRPIHYFARQNFSTEHIPSFSKALHLLLAKGADLNHTNRHGETALHNAVMYACSDVAIFLLSHKTANLAARNVYGETVLNYAIRSYKKELVEKLLELGMDPRQPDDRGNKTALQVAASLGAPAKDIFNLLKARASALDMKDMTPEQKTRYRMNLAIEEIITTEIEYLQDLRVLISVYVEPLKKNQQDDTTLVKYLTKMEMQSIFGNVEEIYEVASAFVKDLPSMDSNWQANPVPPPIGKIFRKHTKAFQVYEKVCTHQHVSTEWLDRALGKDEKKGRPTPFAEFCDKAKQLKACRKLDLAAFLMKPFQRITKYPLLLREVLGYSDESYADYEDIKKAQEEINAIISGANEKKRISDNLQSIIKIQSRIEWPSQSLVNSMVPLIAKKGRTLTSQGDLQVSVNGEKFAARHVYLFSDAVVVVQRIKKEKKTKKKFLFICQLLFETATAADVKDGSIEYGKQLKACFSIEDGKHKVLICCTSEPEKAEWFEHITKGIELAKSGATSKKGSSLQEAIKQAKPGEKGPSALSALQELKTQGSGTMTMTVGSGTRGGGSGTTLTLPSGKKPIHRRGGSSGSSGPLLGVRSSLAPIEDDDDDDDGSGSSGDEENGANSRSQELPAEARSTDTDAREDTSGERAEASSGEAAAEDSLSRKERTTTTPTPTKKARASVYLGALSLPRFGSGPADDATLKKKKKKKKKNKTKGDDKKDSVKKISSSSSLSPHPPPVVTEADC